MKILRTKQFKKEFKKLRESEKKRAEEAILKFKKNPFDITLRNHKLAGKFEGVRSISAGGDLRILFREKGNFIEILFLTIGSHSQLYG